MKKILFLFTLTLMVSCKPETPMVDETETEKTTDWKIEVKYLDKTIDTMVVRSVNAPFLYIDDHVSIVTFGDSYSPVASYVKSMNILNEK